MKRNVLVIEYTCPLCIYILGNVHVLVIKYNVATYR